MAKDSTIYDVAELSRVSITTVSRFLNSPERVAKNTRNRIEAAMAQLHFVPKAEAVARARQGVKRIGVLTPFFTAPSFVERLRGIQHALSSTAYDLITYAVENEAQLKGYLSMLAVSNRIDGLIILALPFTDEDVERFEKHNIPIVCIEVGHSRVSSVQIDNHLGGRMAAEHLLNKGYRRLGFLGDGGQPEYTLHATEQRLEGYKDYCTAYGHPLEDKHIIYHEYGLHKTEEAVREVLLRPDRPDAFFCASDLQAIAVVKTARQLGIEIPRELGLLGFDDIEVSDYMEISTISQSLEHSGEVSVEMLISLLKQPDQPRKCIHMGLSIKERKTT